MAPRRRLSRRELSGHAPPLVRAVLDFGASGARAALVQVSAGGVELLGMAEVSGPSGMARPGQVMRRTQIADLAERALQAAELTTATVGDLPVIADEAIVGLTGPLLAAYSEACHLQRADPIAPIFEAELIEALASAQQRNLGALREQGKVVKIRPTLVASQLVGAMSMRADTGRAERLPDVTRGVPGLAGELLSVVICNLTWPAKGLEFLERVLDDLALDLADAAPIAQTVAAGLPLPDAILLDVGREHTEIALAEGGALSALASIPFGGHSFTQALMTALHLSEPQAEGAKLSHARARTTGRSPVARELAAMAGRWRAAVEQKLLELAGSAPLPSRAVPVRGRRLPAGPAGASSRPAVGAPPSLRAAADNRAAAAASATRPERPAGPAPFIGARGARRTGRVGRVRAAAAPAAS